MNTHTILRWWTAGVLAVVATVQAQTPVRVTADNVNLRAKPQLSAEIVGQAHYDEVLSAREIGEEWVEVAVPDPIDLWVSEEFIQRPDNVVTTRRLNVRAGPNINYNVVATLERGATVIPRGELSGWLKIAPPEAASIWIHRDFVERVVEEAAPVAEGETPMLLAADAPAPLPADGAHTRPEAGALPTPIVSPSVPVGDHAGREIPVPPPRDLNLIPLPGQGRLAAFEGELRAAPLLGSPTRYRIVRWQNNQWEILCHVYGQATKLRALQNKRVRVNGREYWIQGASAPVLVPDLIQEIPGG